MREARCVFRANARVCDNYRGARFGTKEKIGDKRWLHAAQSNFHDVAPATALGIDNAWVNRKSETGGVKPTYEVRDMTGLADLLA